MGDKGVGGGEEGFEFHFQQNSSDIFIFLRNPIYFLKRLSI